MELVIITLSSYTDHDLLFVFVFVFVFMLHMETS